MQKKTKIFLFFLLCILLIICVFVIMNCSLCMDTLAIYLPWIQRLLRTPSTYENSPFYHDCPGCNHTIRIFLPKEMMNVIFSVQEKYASPSKWVGNREDEFSSHLLSLEPRWPGKTRWGVAPTLGSEFPHNAGVFKGGSIHKILGQRPDLLH